MEWTITTNDTRKERLSRLRTLLTERVLVVDGAMGTRIQQLGLTADDYGGPELEGCLEYLNVTRPDAIAGIHRSYLDAGADIYRDEYFRLDTARVGRVRAGGPRRGA